MFTEGSRNQASKSVIKSLFCTCKWERFYLSYSYEFRTSESSDLGSGCMIESMSLCEALDLGGGLIALYAVYHSISTCARSLPNGRLTYRSNTDTHLRLHQMLATRCAPPRPVLQVRFGHVSEITTEQAANQILRRERDCLISAD